MTRLLALLFACAALGLVVAGCGGDDGDGGGGGGSTGGGAQVTMEGIKFNPSEVTVKAGDLRSCRRAKRRAFISILS